MKAGKTIALTLGLAAGALLAVVATKSSKRVKSNLTKRASDTDQRDDTEVHYI